VGVKKKKKTKQVSIVCEIILIIFLNLIFFLERLAAAANLQN
jgi:regulatory protein YycI of two-component signal transduction system YycFG